MSSRRTYWTAPPGPGSQDGDTAQARAAFEQPIRFARDHGLIEILTSALNDLGDLEIESGELAAGRLLCEESLALAAQRSDAAVVALINLVHVAMLERREGDAAVLARQALQCALGRGDLLMTAWAAIATAWPRAAQGDLQRAARLLGSGLEFLQRAGAEKQWMDTACERAVSKILRDRLDEPTVHALLDEGRKTSVEAAARDALHEAIEHPMARK
jgi:hypothetical protein